MRLSWNEIRVRASSFARKWADAGYEKGETQSFYNDFFRIFGVRRESVARYEEQVAKRSSSAVLRDRQARRPPSRRQGPTSATCR